jgi:inorganic pyrophosphatase
MPSFLALSPFDSQGALRVVVETPKGSAVKYDWDPDLGAFAVARELMLGLAYPYDFGFVPGTHASDGDPLDAIVLHAAASYPGIVLTCRALGMVALRQKEGRRWIDNHRIVAVPAWEGHSMRIDDLAHLPARSKAELEQFFVNTAYFTSKKIELMGWRGALAAEALVKRSTLPAAKSSTA